MVLPSFGQVRKLFRLDPDHRDQGEVEIADPRQQTVKGGLIRYHAGNERFATACQGQLHSLESLPPGRSEMAFDSNHVVFLAATLGIRLKRGV